MTRFLAGRRLWIGPLRGVFLFELPRLVPVAAAREAAGAAGLDVLAARAGELEQEFAFGVARQLFESISHVGCTETFRASAGRGHSSSQASPAMKSPHPDRPRWLRVGHRENGGAQPHQQPLQHVRVVGSRDGRRVAASAHSFGPCWFCQRVARASAPTRPGAGGSDES